MNAACSHFLCRSAELWSAWMWPMAWHVTVLVAVLTVLTSLLRRQPARLRYLLWTLVLVRLCLPPATALPTSWGWWLDFAPARPMDDSVGPPIRVPSSLAAETTALAVPTVPASLPLFLVWCGVLAVRLGMLATGWLQVRSWVRRALPVPRPEWFDLLLQVKSRLGYDPEVRLLNSEACATPLVVGWRRPAILLPRAVLEGFSTAELEAVLSHEISHLRRGDSLLRMIQSGLGCLYFFHPAVWWSWSQLNRLREDACDESTVMALEGRRKAYAAALVKAGEILGYAQPVLSLGVLDSFRPVADRVRRILDPDFPVRDLVRWRVVVGYGAAALLFLPAAGREESRAPAELERRSDAILATPPIASTERTELMRALDRLRGPGSRDSAVESLIAAGRLAERPVIDTLGDANTETRLAGYRVLAVVGGTASLDHLHEAFLHRSGVEQREAKLALDAVADRLRNEIPSIRTSPFSQRLVSPED